MTFSFFVTRRGEARNAAGEGAGVGAAMGAGRGDLAGPALGQHEGPFLTTTSLLVLCLVCVIAAAVSRAAPTVLSLYDVVRWSGEGEAFMRSRCPVAGAGAGGGRGARGGGGGGGSVSGGKAFGARLVCSYSSCRHSLASEDQDLASGAARRGNTLGPLQFSPDAMVSLSSAMEWVAGSDAEAEG